MLHVARPASRWPSRWLLLVVPLVVGCSPSEPPVEQPTAQHEAPGTAFNAWLDAEFETYLDFSPLSRSRLGDRSAQDRLDDVSEAALTRQLEWRRTSVAAMRARFERDELSAQERMSWDVWEYLLARDEAAAPFLRHRFIFGRNGPQALLPNSLINFHKVESREDLEAYLARLQSVDEYLGQYLDRARAAAADGIRPPYFDYDLALRQSRQVLDGAPFAAGPPVALWEDIERKITALEAALTVPEADAYRDRFRAALVQSVGPAYRAVIDWLEADRQHVPAEAAGAWSLPDGDAYYRQMLKEMTTLKLDATGIHEIGLAEVDRIHGEIDAIRQKVGFDGTLTEFFEHMRSGPEFYYPSTDEGREAYLEQARGYLDGMTRALPGYFGILPRAGLEVRRVEAFREQPGGAAHYSRGTPDGSRPGVFYAHLVDMAARPRYRLESLAYHEGLPGHHMQISIQQELDGLPRFRGYHGYAAFSEGWGLYAEYLASEMGFYTDPYNDFGRLGGELWRAIRLVVDTGIHALRWSEQQAVDYALANSANNPAAVRSEIRRYFNNPGQATAYKIGMLKVLELREQARSRLGEAFDPRAFHDTVLGGGALPLELLERRVGQWLDGEQGA
jgi:uncharacterized protein (DUF885 family)